MIKLYRVSIILLLLIASVYSADLCKKHFNIICPCFCLENVSIDIEEEGILFTCPDDDRSTVEITDDGELFVKGRKVALDKDQEQLLLEFDAEIREVIAEAVRIGYQGAQVGIRGASIGLKAVSGLACVLLTDYRQEDLDRDLEQLSEELEMQAEKIEKKADDLEERAEALKELHFQLKSEIPALRELDWF
ncbi:MAG TPA: DUF2884 family protein [Caldithrix sp.]|nr:DUF2884 family protein [Caldithrix sp.]